MQTFYDRAEIKALYRDHMIAQRARNKKPTYEYTFLDDVEAAT